MSTDTNNNDETRLYSDLKGFLASDRLDLRQAATEAVLQIHDDDGRHKLVTHGLVPLLARNVSDVRLSTLSLQALLQLCSDESTPLAKTTASQCTQELLDAGGLDRLMEILLTNMSSSEILPEQQWRERVNLAMSLLANVTRPEAGSIALCGRRLPDEAVVAKAHNANAVDMPPKPTLELLLARFMNPQYTQPDIDYDELLLQASENDPTALDSHTHDPFQHFAAVLMNATQVEQGRRFLLQLHYAPDNRETPPTSVFQTLLPQLRHANPIRRRGVAGVIRNCASDKDSAFWFTTQINLVDQHLLFPLAGPEELDDAEKQHLNPDLWLPGPSKRREPDHYTRLFLVQAMLLLCKAGRQARRELNRCKTSVVLKWAGMVEEFEDVAEVMEECLLQLLREKSGCGGGDDNVEEVDGNMGPRIELLEDDDDEEESEPTTLSASQPVRGATHVTQEDYDNVD